MKSLVRTIVNGVALALVGSSPFLIAQDATPPQPPAHLLTVVIYKAGAEYKPHVPPEQQLAEHFGYVGQQFASGKLIAYGPRTDIFRGLYILDTADTSASDAFVANDPGVKAHLLQVDEKLVWATVIHDFTRPTFSDSFFFLRLQPGAKWQTGKSLTEQAIGPHFEYMVAQAKAGLVLAAGPSATGDEGCYVVRATRSELDKLLADDPGEQSGLLKPLVLPWHVLKMQPIR